MNQNKLIKEYLRRAGLGESCFHKQREVFDGIIDRGERQVSVLTSRRSGKTNGAIRIFARDQYDHPNSKYAYIALTRNSAREIVWQELERLNDEHNLGLEMLGYCLRATTPNGCQLTLYGADQPGWMKKFKGLKLRGVIIDEAGEYDIDLHDLIFRYIRPCLTDQNGWLMLIGTPGIVPNSYWYHVTQPNEEKRIKGWHLYQWHAFDNPHISTQFKADMVDLREVYGEELEDLPWYRREWLGEWSLDNSKNVYQYHPDRNDMHEFQPRPGDRYILGVDAGFSDAAAFVVGVYNDQQCDELYFIDCYREIGMHLDAMADKVEEFLAKYPGLEVIGDPDNAHFMAFLREKRNIPISDAQKLKKHAYIQYLNNSLVAGKTKLLMPKCLPLAKEMMELVKSYRKSHEREEGGVTMGEWKENPKQPNDLCDAALYVHRYALPYTFQEPPPKIEHGSQEYYEQIERKLQSAARSKATGEEPWWRSI